MFPQIHATAAELFIVTGPFQFSPSFRAKFPAVHRVFGYVFVGAAIVSAVTALLVLIPNTEFGPLGQAVFAVQALVLLYFLFVAVKMAKEKKFQVHRRYMIRAAATGSVTFPSRSQRVVDDDNRSLVSRGFRLAAKCHRFG